MNNKPKTVELTEAVYMELLRTDAQLAEARVIMKMLLRGDGEELAIRFFEKWPTEEIAP